MKPRLALLCLLAVVVSLGGTGCATASRSTTAPAPSAPEPIAESAPAPEPPPPTPAPVEKAERPKASKRGMRPSPETKTRTSLAAKAPEPGRPQSDGVSLERGAPVAFDPSVMTRPQRVSGREPQLTPEAQAERVRGTALVRCVVTHEGQVTNCRLLNGLPYMNQELLESLSTWRVTPATTQGKPIDVDYTFVVRIPTG